MSDKGNIINSSKKDFNEIEETVVSVSRISHEQLKRPREFKSNTEDLPSNISDYDHETGKEDRENMIGEIEKVGVCTDSSPPYCKDNLSSCGE